MKILITTLFLLTGSASYAAEPQEWTLNQSTEDFIVGGWKLEVFTTTEDGVTKDWCDGLHGLIMYTKSGQMSVAINCDESQKDKNVYYAGNYKVDQNKVSHLVTNSINPDLIDKTLVRSATHRGRNTLIYEGNLNGSGFFVEWTRK